MPIYLYRCPECNHSVEEFQHIRDDPIVTCPECSSPSYRRVPALPHTDMKEFRTPIEMYSIALDTVEDIREFKRRCPTVAVSENPRDEMFGIPIAATRKQKLEALKTMGFTEKN